MNKQRILFILNFLIENRERMKKLKENQQKIERNIHQKKVIIKKIIFVLY